MQKEPKKIDLNFKSMTLDEVTDNIRRGANVVIKGRKTETEELRAKHSKLQDEIDKLLQKFVDGLISVEDYRTKHQKLSQKRFKVLQTIAKYDNADDDHSEFVIKLLEEAYAECKIPKNSVH